MPKTFLLLFLLLLCLSACELAASPSDGSPTRPIPTSANTRVPITITLDANPATNPAPGPGTGERGEVVRVIDGDTIDVDLNGVVYRVRYVGVNTPERDEACYREAVDANAVLVQGQTVTLVPDVSDTDRYGRLLRYVYVGDLFVNESLVRDGWAEAVRYPPDELYYDAFLGLEAAAARDGLGCHWTGVFN